MRIAPGMPLRPSGEVILTEGPVGAGGAGAAAKLAWSNNVVTTSEVIRYASRVDDRLRGVADEIAVTCRFEQVVGEMGRTVEIRRERQ